MLINLYKLEEVERDFNNPKQLVSQSQRHNGIIKKKADPYLTLLRSIPRNHAKKQETLIILLGANKDAMEEAIANARNHGHKVRVQNTLANNPDETNLEETDIAPIELQVHDQISNIAKQRRKNELKQTEVFRLLALQQRVTEIKSKMFVLEHGEVLKSSSPRIQNQN